MSISTSDQNMTSFSFPGPPPYLLVANLVDVRQIHPDGSGDRSLVEEPRGAIIALDYDPVLKKVRRKHPVFL